MLVPQGLPAQGGLAPWATFFRRFAADWMGYQLSVAAPGADGPDVSRSWVALNFRSLHQQEYAALQKGLTCYSILTSKKSFKWVGSYIQKVGSHYV